MFFEGNPCVSRFKLPELERIADLRRVDRPSSSLSHLHQHVGGVHHGLLKQAAKVKFLISFLFG